MGWSNAGWQSDQGGWYKNAVVAPSGTTLDPATLGSGLALTNGSLTATSAAGANTNARSVASHAAGKYYCEFTVGQASNLAIGICTTTYSNAFYLQQTSASVATGYGSATIVGAGGTVTCPALIAGHIYGMAVDKDNEAIWIKDITAAGNWNANGTANPATNTNGATFGGGSWGTAGTVAAHPAVTCGGAGDNATFNFGGSAYAGTPPSGFGNW